MSITILKGTVVSAPALGKLDVTENGYLVAEDGNIIGVFPALPEQYAGAAVEDYGNALILQSFADLHLHAPQYPMLGMGMDLPLLDWLNTYTFPTEARFADPDYAREVYRKLARELIENGTTRVCMFSSLHRQATLILMEELEKAGVTGYVGKVNMDRNGLPPVLQEETEESKRETLLWLDQCRDFRHIKPILTPRFTPSCTDGLLDFLGKLAAERGLPVQSHLSENQGEIAWVRELCPDSKNYGDAYDAFGLFGGPGCPAVMAHCVYSDEEETALMKRRNVFAAHCPASNTNLSSGIAPVRRFLREGLSVGLGSDVAGGTHTSIFRAMADAVQVSKLRWRLVDASLEPLTAKEAFCLGTMGGGAFFGKVGSFAPDYEFDALVIDDRRYTSQVPSALEKRLEQTIYLSDERDIRHKFVQGRQIF